MPSVIPGPLTQGELHALRNLAARREGVLTPFLNISDARALTDLGLARHSRQGWELTSDGAAYLARVDLLPDSDDLIM